MQQGITKLLFVIQPQSIIDVITNSSSELFVFQGDSKDVIEEMIKDIYPDYENEYAQLESLRDSSVEELDSLMNWFTGSWIYPARKENYRIPGTFTFNEVYEPESDKPAHNGEIQYRLKRNWQGESKWDYSFVTAENKDWVLDKLDPDHTMMLLYSLDENPNWEMQERLEQIGIRYHLG